MDSNESRRISAIAKRPRWTPEEASAVLEAAARSGVTHGEFAATYGIGMAKLSQWRRRLQPELCAGEPVQFEEVHVHRATDGSCREAERVEVVTPSGYIVRIGASFDGEMLRRLFDVLEGSAGAC